MPPLSMSIQRGGNIVVQIREPFGPLFRLNGEVKKMKRKWVAFLMALCLLAAKASAEEYISIQHKGPLANRGEPF